MDEVRRTRFVVKRVAFCAVAAAALLLLATAYPAIEGWFASAAPGIERKGPLLASWEAVGGCGAGAASSGGVGIKWIGRNVTGGLFNAQTQVNYTTLQNKGGRQSHYFLNTMLARDLTEHWTVGANVPLVYKSMPNYQGFHHDIVNSGLGDVSLLLTRKLGPTNATSLTATLGLPTGVSDAKWTTFLLKQSEQTGFGRVTGALMLDHTLDQIWGVVVLGGVAAYRGGENKVGNYRASTASGYAYAGYFLGPFVPAVGLALSGFTGRDRDLSTEQYTALFSATPGVSLEWSNAWMAVLLGATFPYQYDGVVKNTEGAPRSPWGWNPWTVAVGISVAPF